MTSVEEYSGRSFQPGDPGRPAWEVTLNRDLKDRNVRLACLPDQTSSSLRVEPSLIPPSGPGMAQLNRHL